MTRRHTLTQILLLATPLALTLAVACGDDDGRMMFDPSVEIGAGDIGTFDAISDGDTLFLVRGPQGGQHVWIALRATNLDTSPALIQLLVERERDMYAASIPFQVRLTFSDAVLPRAEYTQISGLALMIPDPTDVLGEDIIIHARVSENVSGGASAESEVRVHIDWDADAMVPRGDGGPPPDGPAPLDPPDAGVLDDAGVPVPMDAG